MVAGAPFTGHLKALKIGTLIADIHEPNVLCVAR
jgi:hypothetical protein